MSWRTLLMVRCKLSGKTGFTVSLYVYLVKVLKTCWAGLHDRIFRSKTDVFSFMVQRFVSLHTTAN